MIRFLCPNCSRRYELPEALARLPLVCKGCGQPLVVPETSTEPEAKPEPPKSVLPPPSPKPEPPKMVAPPPPPKSEPPKVEVPPPSAPPVHTPERVTVAAVESRLPHADHPLTNGQPAAYPKNGPLFEQPEVLEALEIAPPAPPVAIARPSSRKPTAAIVDGIVAIILLAIGVFCGELLARQSTSDVLRDAGSAAKFPPIDFLMWLAPPVLFLLIHSLLISRRKSVGSWLARRSET